MKYSSQLFDLAKIKSTCLVTGVYLDGELPPSSLALDDMTGGSIKRAIKQSGVKWKVGSSLLIYDCPAASIERILLVGLGKAETMRVRDFQKLAGLITTCAQALQISQLSISVAGMTVSGKSPKWKLRQLVLISASGCYQYTQTVSDEKKDPFRLEEIQLLVADDDDISECEKVVREASVIAEGVEFCRKISDLPGNLCTPAYLAKQARQLQKKLPIKTQILDHGDLKKAGMGALLAVSRGSRQKPHLIIMEYQGNPAQQQPVVLVGKGLTFDAGGISLKPGAKMDEMKYDMCGAASVLGTMQTIAELSLPINCIGIIPTSENLPDGDAYKPGDVITSMSGKTIEVLNTDAEGRLILCDALTYSRKFDPAVVIDIATLTGACVIALGGHASGLFSEDDELAKELLSAGDQVHDRVWRMPLWDDYQEQLKSNFADLANVGGREGGAITAARFLSSFTEDLHWAHLDIAGTAWLSGNKKGATGRPVALLCRYLINKSEQLSNTKTPS